MSYDGTTNKMICFAIILTKMMKKRMSICSFVNFVKYMLQKKCDDLYSTQQIDIPKWGILK